MLIKPILTTLKWNWKRRECSISILSTESRLLYSLWKY